MDVPQFLKRGSRGQAVRFLQVILNARLERRPKLRAGGIFGFRTESATKEFQVKHGLAVDGIVGPDTWAEVTAAVARRPQVAPHVRKFVARLGAVDDFVRSVKEREGQTFSKVELLDRVGEFPSTSTRLRYLIVQRPYVGVIDFPQFFAAASEAYAASCIDGGFVTRGHGKTLVLGVGNEVSRCGQELKRTLQTRDAAKIDPCFSRTDAESNRLGAEFGRLVAVAEADGTPESVHDQLRRYLQSLRPLSRRDTAKIKRPSNGRMALEALAATLLGLYGVPFADTY